MDRIISQLLTRGAITVCAGLFAIGACTRTTDRVVEPVGGRDASTTTPEVGDAGMNPLGPIAHPEPSDDFRLVRSPEFGTAREPAHASLVLAQGEQMPPSGLGGSGGVGSGGIGAGGVPTRPAATCGGAQFY